MSPKIGPDFSLTVTPEITLHLPKVTDAPELFALVDLNRAHLREFLGWLDSSQNVVDTQKFIEDNLPQWLQLNTLHLSIKKANKLIGAVGFHEIDFLNHSTSMGYWLDKRYEGNGIMTKSVTALIDYGFKTLHLHRIQILCATHNHRSCAIANRLGFQQEGLLKEALYHYGAYFDAYVYGLISRKEN